MAFRLSDLFSCFPSPGLFPPSDRSLIDEEQSDSNIWWSAFVSYAHDNNFSSSLRALPEEDKIALKKFLLQMGSCDQKGWWNKEKVTVFFLRSGDYYYLSQSEGEIN